MSLKDKIGDFGWILIGVGAMLRRLGGFHWKWTWRYIGPAVVGGIAYAYGYSLARSILATALIAAVSTLGIEGAWATDWRIFMFVGQGILSGMALWPLAGVNLKSLRIPKEAWTVVVFLGLTKAALAALSNNLGVPHGIYESCGGGAWYGAAAWLIVQKGPSHWKS